MWLLCGRALSSRAHTRANTSKGGGKGSDVYAPRDEWAFVREAAHAGLNTQDRRGTTPPPQGCILQEKEKCLRLVSVSPR